MLHVVDVSHPDPEGQISAVRHVFADIPGAMDVPEVIVLNKADVADPAVVARLRSREVHSVVVSAHTGEGIDELLALIADQLPAPRRRRSTSSSRTTGATSSAGCTPRARSRPSSTPSAAPRCAPRSTPRSRPSCTRRPSPRPDGGVPGARDRSVRGAHGPDGVPAGPEAHTAPAGRTVDRSAAD